MRRLLLTVMLLTACALVGAASAAEPGDSAQGQPPANVWMPLGDGSFCRDKAKGERHSQHGMTLLWIDSLDSAVIPTPPSKTEGFWKLPIESPEWAPVAGSFPAGWALDYVYSHTPKGFCWLPGIKKVLCVMRHQDYTKGPAAGWLVDPATGAWEPLQDPVSMSDKSSDFGVMSCRDGERLPRWGAVAYDALNKEAVHFGGGGVWGRVGREKEKVKPGDWIFDEAARRIRRLTADDAGKVAEARKWYPGHAGTWLFSEAEKKWRPTEQPMGAQPSGRAMPGMVYDSDEKKIVLFGGDDLARCLADTWVYDCAKRTWSEVAAKVAPPARANHAMVYIPEQKAVLMAGGYGGGWTPMKDVWVFRTSTGEWTQLNLPVPDGFGPASATYDGKRRQAIVAFSGSSNPGGRNMPLYTLRLDLAAAPKAPPAPADPARAWHCKVWNYLGWGSLLPGEWEAGANRPGDPAAGRAELAALPANTWVKRQPPVNVPGRGWGSYVYDMKTHKGFAWGGGHSAYPGAEISEYDLLTNRWRGMAEPTNYNPVWLHGMVGGPPGVSFGGWSLLPSHARKSYGMDPLSDSVVTYAGDVYSIKHHSVITHIGPFPLDWGGPSYQVAYATAKHGLYAFACTRSSKARSVVARANVAAGTWDVVAEGTMGGHDEHDFLVWDSKRDRLLYFKSKEADVWAFDFATKQWVKEEPAGKKPPKALGDATYIPEMDAVFMAFTEAPGAPEKLWFYRCDERKWYSAPSAGDYKGGNASGRDSSPIYDPELKIIVRMHLDGDYGRWTGVTVMRLDPAGLKLAPVE